MGEQEGFWVPSAAFPRRGQGASMAPGRGPAGVRGQPQGAGHGLGVGPTDVTSALGLRAAPRAVALAGALGRSPERVARLAAEAQQAARAEAVPQPDAVRGGPRVAAESRARSCRGQNHSGPAG